MLSVSVQMLLCCTAYPPPKQSHLLQSYWVLKVATHGVNMQQLVALSLHPSVLHCSFPVQANLDLPNWVQDPSVLRFLMQIELGVYLLTCRLS